MRLSLRHRGPCPAIIGFFAIAAAIILVQAQQIQARPVSEIRILILPDKDRALWESLARDLIPLKSGEPYTVEALEDSLTALKDSRLFGGIHVPDPVQGAAGISLTFELTPYSRIKDIRIRNAFPLYQREVLNVMQMEVGGPYDPDLLRDQAGRIRQLFRQQGFPGAHVRVSAEKDVEDGCYVVDVVIEKGPYQRIRKVRFEGNLFVSSLRLKLSCQTWRSTLLFGPARRFEAKKMKEDVRELTDLYRKKGFAEVSITARADPASPEGTGRSDGVDVVFTIQEGPQYHIRFQGNQALSHSALEDELTLDTEGNLNNFGLKKSLRNIRNRYASQGFASAQVRAPAPASGTIGRAGGQMDIRITEGPRDRVADLVVTGNLSLPPKSIRDNILTPDRGGIFDPTVLQADADAVRALYLQKGFAHVSVETKVSYDTDKEGTNRWATAVLAITEGPRARLEAVNFSGLFALPRDRALSLLALQPGSWYDPSLVSRDRDTLFQALAEAGYPHVRISGEPVFSPDNTRVHIAYGVDQGPEVRVGQIFYTGNLRTRQPVLSREMEIRPGDPFSLSKIVASRRNLLGLGALDAARIRSVGLKTREEAVDLIVEVSEKKPYFAELGMGYDTERHLYMTGAAGDRNLAGRDLSLQSEAELSQIGHQLEASLTDPRFLTSRFTSHTRMFTEKREEFNQDFGIRTYGISQDFLRFFKEKNLTVNAGLVYEFRDQYLTVQRDLTEEEAEEYRTRHILALSPGITYRTTDSYIRPRKGILAATTLDLSKGIDTALDDFIKFRTDLRVYLPVAQRLTLALRGGYGYILTYGSQASLPDDQLFFLGGTTTVRGFDENMLQYDADGNALGGLEMVLGSAEARIDLGQNIEASLFYDIGAVRKAEEPGSDDSLRDGVGLGLRYQTPVGPIGLLYGWKLDPRPGEGRGSFHFSMGYTF